MKKLSITKILLLTIGLLLAGCNGGNSTTSTGQSSGIKVNDPQTGSWKILDNDPSHYSPYVQNSSSSWQSVASYNGTPYIAFADGAHGNKLSVMKYESGLATYVNLGSPGFSQESVTYVSLKISSKDGTPYVAFIDETNLGESRPRVMNYNGNNWIDVGGNYPDPNLSKGVASFISLAITNEGVPVVAFQDSGDSNHTGCNLQLMCSCVIITFQ